MKEWLQMVKNYTNTFKYNPENLILLMHCYAGHGMSMDGRQIILLNEFDIKKRFYKAAPAES